MDSASELRAEQAHVDRAYARLERLREQAAALASGVLDSRLSTTHQARYERDVTVHASARRLAALRLGSLPLVFGRIDDVAGDRFHIGRVAVQEPDLSPLVVDWRAPVAEPFYRATPHDPRGLVRRRHFRTRGQRLLAIDDERFGEPPAGDALPVVGEGALLEAISRSRTGRMSDIVETIQAEQDAVIRAPLEGTLVVQGGPGTGKTAVALHRAAYLLYTHRIRLERTGVLLIGPTPVFLRYIEEVLPALGEQRVRLATLGGLVPWARVSATDPPELARLKGDARMAKVLARIPARGGPREALRELYARPERAARNLLSAGEQRLLRRPQWQGWTTADLPLLDELLELRPPPKRRRAPRLDPEERWEIARLIGELEAITPMDPKMRADLLDRVTDARLELEETEQDEASTYGHVLVDEAQDLTPMQWRMLVRRCPSRSMTIVGDLGQATGPWTPSSWDDVVALLGTRRATTTELTINYRTPAEIMAFADVIRPRGLRPGRPVRHAGEPVGVREVAGHELAATVARAVDDALAAVDGTIGVVAPETLVPSLGVGHDRVSTSTVANVKGLEFDAVVVVEPSAIAEEAGLRALYVALTRATRRLEILTTGPLPAELGRAAVSRPA